MTTIARRRPDRPGVPQSATLALPVAPTLPETVRRALLDVARSALRVATGTGASEQLEMLVARGRGTAIRAATFVTLTERDELRGCIGTLDPDRLIEETVARAALNAALHDPRFRPVEADELPAIRVEVSVLGRPVELEVLADFIPGIHGVIVEQGGRSALLLPEVASDHEWGAEEMLTACCRKAGLPGDAWQGAQTRRMIFATVRFGGRAVEGGPTEA